MNTATARPDEALKDSVGPASIDRLTDELRSLLQDVEYELVDGVPRRRNMGADASLVALNLGSELRSFCLRTNAGTPYGADCAYHMFPERPLHYRKPDVSFLSAEQWPPFGTSSGWFDFAPHLAVEVVSPNDTANALHAKVQEYHAAGSALVWVVDPPMRTLQDLRPGGYNRTYQAQDTMRGDGALDGFELLIDDVMVRLPPTGGPDG